MGGHWLRYLVEGVAAVYIITYEVRVMVRGFTPKCTGRSWDRRRHVSEYTVPICAPQTLPLPSNRDILGARGKLELSLARRYIHMLLL